MTFKEMRELAKEKGINTYQMGKEDLEKALAEIDEDGDSNENEEQTEEKVQEKEIEVGKNDLAIVLNGSSKVRVYSLKQHGVDFYKLAKQYADHRNLTVELAIAQPGIICPRCGHEFIPKA